MIRKTVALLIVLLIVLSNVVLAQSPAVMTLLTKTKLTEEILYGEEQSGALFDRINKLETDMYGQRSQQPLATKIDRLYSYMINTSEGAPSFMLKLNAVEWTLTRVVTDGAAKARLEKLEQVIVGNTETSAFEQRLNKLIKLAYSDTIAAGRTALAQDTLIKIKMLTALTSKSSRVGDKVRFEAAQDVYVGPMLVIAKGAVGTGKVLSVEQARNFGRDGKLDISFDTITAVDGSVINTYMGEKAKKETLSLAKAAGATIAGLVILGPVGVVGGAFVHGKDANIPAGTEMYLQAKNNTNMYGITTK